MATKKAAKKAAKKASKKATKTPTAPLDDDSNDSTESGVTRTVRMERNAVLVHASTDEFLLYKLTASGATPIFTLTDSDGNLIMSSQDAPNPPGSGTYQREWPRPVDPVATVTSHTMGMHFLAAIKYTYEVEHRLRSASGSGLIQLLIDIDYESDAATDTAFQRLGVSTV